MTRWGKVVARTPLSYIVWFIVTAVFVYSCQSISRDELFECMNDSYKDLEIERGYYFLKDFGRTQKAVTINGKMYWLLKCNKTSYFYLGGYCRVQGDCLLHVPFNYAESSDKMEDTLFCFSVPEYTSWNLRFDFDSKTLVGDSVVFMGKVVASNDTLYQYMHYPYSYNFTSKDKMFSDHRFKVYVSKRFGPIRVLTLAGEEDTVYEAELFPEGKFRNKLNSKLFL